MPISGVIPRLSGASDPAVQAWADRLSTFLQGQLDDRTSAVKTGIKPTTITTTTALDPGSSTLVNTINVLGTLILALQKAGRLN